MGETLRPDICVIGAGSGGLTVAAAAASFGVDVVLIERGRMGGDCLNDGCVPSKAMIAAAKHAAAIREAPRFGVSAGEPRVDFSAVHDHVRGVIAAIAPNDSQERFERLGVTVIRAEARFVGKNAVEAGGRRVEARRFVLATGSSPLVPPIDGLDTVPFLTNETIFDRTETPEHLLVIGGGPVGLELAQAHRRLGAKVTVLESAKALAHDDPELTAIVLARLAEEGVAIRQGAKVTKAARTPDGAIELTYETKQGEETVTGSHLLVAVGRTPNLAGLDLERAGIEQDEDGLKVRPDLRTTNRRVYAVGDVAGGPQFTHVANYHAGLVIRSLLFRLPARVRKDHIPHVTYTDPELGQVGLTEREANEGGQEFQVLRWPYADNDRAQTERETAGLLKLLVGRRGAILGAGVAGARAGELTNLFSLAVSQSLAVSDLRDFISPYPTFSEIGKRAATAYYRPYTERASVRGIVKLLQRFG